MGHKARRRRYGVRSTSWKEKRRRRLEIDGYRCRTCGHDGSTYQLEVHHVSYDSWGDEDVERDLITLCSECHRAITDVVRRRRYEEYANVEFEDLVPTVITRIEVNYGMANIDLSVDFIGSVAAPQRPDGKSVEQMGEGDEADFGQEGEDGC